MTEEVKNKKIDKESVTTPDRDQDTRPDFDFQDIGAINLKEAEEIANEDLFFISEKDLLDGLEEFDLIPLKDESHADDSPEPEAKQDSKVKEKVLAEQPGQTQPGSAEKDAAVVEKETAAPEVPEDVALSASEPEGIEAGESETEIQQDVKETDETLDIDTKTTVEDNEQVAPSLEDENNLDHITTDEDSVKWVPVDKVLAEKKPEQQDTPSGDVYEDKEIVFVDEIAEAETADTPKKTRILRTTTDELVFVDELSSNNDIFIYNHEQRKNQFPNETIELPGTVEGDSVSETGVDDTMPVYGFGSVDFIDDDLEFVNFSIVQDDYGSYIKEIDDFNKFDDQMFVSPTVELLGLTHEEIRLFEDILYNEEYKDVNFKEVFDYFQPREVIPFALDKNCRYILHETSRLSDSEKMSIEEDVTSSSALIYEENVDEIKNLLRESLKEVDEDNEKDVENVYDITDQVVILEDDLDVDRFVREFPVEKQSDIKKLLTYFDGLFEKLPESTVKRFADSEYYELYIKVLHDLGV